MSYNEWNINMQIAFYKTNKHAFQISKGTDLWK
jgi:hypothetical protein